MGYNSGESRFPKATVVSVVRVIRKKRWSLTTLNSYMELEISAYSLYRGEGTNGTSCGAGTNQT